MSEKLINQSEKEYWARRKDYGMSLTQPSIPKGTQPFEDWELNIKAEENNIVVFRSEETDRFIATIRNLKTQIRLLTQEYAGL